MTEFVVAADEAGRRLDVVLARRAALSRAAAQRLISSGSVTLDGRPVAKGEIVRAGVKVAYRPPAPAGESLLRPEPLDVPVLYEDDDLIVVDKPAGLVVHPAAGHLSGTLVNALLARGIAGGHSLRPGIVHRLDKDTSGLLVVARTECAYNELVKMMAERRIARHYTALVVGAVRETTGTIDAPIGRHVRDRQRMSIHTSHPRRAVTHFRVARRFTEYTLLEVRLETGRTHQIRVHLAAVGHPVAGDVVYGRRPRPPGLARQFLHAGRLQFPHPCHPDRQVDVTAPLPVDLQTFLASLPAP